ncbi:MAG: hypothetical protein A2287_04870 [Candidatus Melainabacteria bacterium RIFOXYA12_FULL_32_12]|nr:MAG: hypothetical protein A2255_06585 [Candidatus Melainabacteria bacterium RIFOXYA2_FULL_32_9]OGI28541.1 MAG: hypothetical protein A2287_04870 [Candidatus Melainabacteria bacterium RIFOXYA12_FULL_32_12]
MNKSIIISERDNIAAVTAEGRVIEFFIHRGNMLLGDVYLAQVENILPSIDAAFVNVGGDRMGFLHASDVAGKGALKDKLTPKQSLVVQIIKEPTGHKGPRVTTSISLPGRFLVLMPDEKGISVSRKITAVKERARLKSVVSLLKPAGVGVIIRTEAENQSESEIQEDLELLLERWNNIVAAADTVTPPNLLYRDQDLLYRVIREACTEEVKEIMVDTPFALHRTNQLLQTWNIGSGIKVSYYKGSDPLLTAKGIDREIRSALQTKVNLPSGGYLYIQTTEALSVIDVNSGKFTSSATQNETIRKTNLEAVQEISRQLRLRNIGGMIIIDFIDMENRVDQLAILEELELALEPDKAKPQVGQLSDLGLVELTRHRQGQSLAELFTKKCPACSGTGAVIEEFNFASPPVEAEFKVRPANTKIRMPQKINNNHNNNHNNKIKPIIAENIVQKQTPDVTKPINTEEKAVTPKKINTTPSVVASTIQKTQKEEKPEIQTLELNDEAVKQYFSSDGYIPNLSKVIVFAAIPSRIAREYMDESYNVNVFSILQELESTEYVINEAQEEIKQKPETINLGYQTSSVQIEKKVHNKIENKEPVKLAQTPSVQEKVAKPADEKNSVLENASNSANIAKSESEAQKPIRRGRKPRSASSAKSRTNAKSKTTNKE